MSRVHLASAKQDARLERLVRRRTCARCSGSAGQRKSARAARAPGLRISPVILGYRKRRYLQPCGGGGVVMSGRQDSAQHSKPGADGGSAPPAAHARAGQEAAKA